MKLYLAKLSYSEQSDSKLRDAQAMTRKGGLTDFEVKHMVGADSLAPILKKLFDMHGNRKSLQLAASLGELTDPLRCVGRDDAPLRLSVYCLISLITNHIPIILAASCD